MAQVYTSSAFGFVGRSVFQRADHEWIEVLDRRWCVRCDVFQKRWPHTEWPKCKPCDGRYDDIRAKKVR